MYEIKVTFKSGMSLKWTAENWDKASELCRILTKKFKQAKNIKIWKLN